MSEIDFSGQRIDRRASSQLVPREVCRLIEEQKEKELAEIKNKLLELDNKYTKLMLLLLANFAGFIVAILQGSFN